MAQGLCPKPVRLCACGHARRRLTDSRCTNTQVGQGGHSGPPSGFLAAAPSSPGPREAREVNGRVSLAKGMAREGPLVDGGKGSHAQSRHSRCQRVCNIVLDFTEKGSVLENSACP